MARVITAVHQDTFTTLMEQLQIGYLEAVAATAGCTMNIMHRDAFRLDALIVRHRDDADETHLWVQLKNTTLIQPGTEGAFVYAFKNEAQLDRLRRPVGGAPAILVVMISHPDQSQWTQGTHEAMTLRHCCYWKNLATADPDETGSKLSVRIDRANVFDADGLLQIMDRIERGEPL